MRLVLVAASIGLLIGLFGTPWLIRILSRHGYAQAIRDESHGHYPAHDNKRGTPSMGGAMIVGGTFVGYFAAHLYTMHAPSPSGLLVLFLMGGLGGGRVRRRLHQDLPTAQLRDPGQRQARWPDRRGRHLRGLLALRITDSEGISPASRAVSFVRDTPLVLPAGLFVRLGPRDGRRDVQRREPHRRSRRTGHGHLRDGARRLRRHLRVEVRQLLLDRARPALLRGRGPLDLAVVAAGAMGACFGFLWWNASPAQIFMGDTGSLALGGLLSGLAILSRTELLLLVLGGLFVVITMSVILQVGGYKLTKKRVFLMAPLQHHFELKGWGEVTIVIRFWVIAGLCVGLGLGLFYAEWVGGGGALG